jgi:lipoprotein signal peptidase
MRYQHKRLFRLIAIICILVVIDIVTKTVVRKSLTPGDSVLLIDDVLRIAFFQNFKGFSWWVPNLPSWVAVVFQVVLIFIVAAAFPVYIFYTETRRRSLWADIAVVGIVASFCGHLSDNIFSSYTVDFIQLFHSPSANFSDVYSTVGIGALAIEMILVFRLRNHEWRGFRNLVRRGMRVRKEFLGFIKNRIRFLR